MGIDPDTIGLVNQWGLSRKVRSSEPWGNATLIGMYSTSLTLSKRR